MFFKLDSTTLSLLWMIEKFQYVLTYQEEPCVEGTFELRLDVVLEANILFNVVIDIFQKLFFNFEFVF